MSDLGENGITLWISRDGKVAKRLDARVESTSEEAQAIIQKIIPQVIDFTDALVIGISK